MNLRNRLNRLERVQQSNGKDGCSVCPSPMVFIYKPGEPKLAPCCPRCGRPVTIGVYLPNNGRGDER
jgi:hypothetical protein